VKVFTLVKRESESDGENRVFCAMLVIAFVFLVVGIVLGFVSGCDYSTNYAGGSKSVTTTEHIPQYGTYTNGSVEKDLNCPTVMAANPDIKRCYDYRDGAAVTAWIDINTTLKRGDVLTIELHDDWFKVS
jgi:hypothetical protein